MQKLWKNGSISYTLIVYYLNFMKKLVLLTLAFLLTACSVVTTPGSKNNQTNPQNTPRNNSSNSSQTDSRTIEQRLSSEVSYGSGAHVVVLFSDFQCPACIRFEGSIMPMLESYAASGRLQIVFKQYPLVSIHKNAYRDSLAAMCAYEQGKYMDYKKRIYDFEENKDIYVFFAGPIDGTNSEKMWQEEFIKKIQNKSLSVLRKSEIKVLEIKRLTLFQRTVLVMDLRRKIKQLDTIKL
jgi:protein-disulfide isomerase